MKKIILTAVLAMTAGGALTAPLKAGAMETLKSSMELSSMRTAETGELPLPSVYTISEATPLQYAFLARETAGSVKNMALRLQGLVTTDHPAKAPYMYTQNVNILADDLVYAADYVRFSMEKGRQKELFLNLARIKKASASLKRVLGTVAGHANYSFWSGPEIGRSADEMTSLAGNIKMASPELYSFVTPALRNPELSKERETFTAGRIAALENWENQYVRGELSFNGFRNLVNDAVDLKTMWELYQQSTLK